MPTVHNKIMFVKVDNYAKLSVVSLPVYTWMYGKYLIDTTQPNSSIINIRSVVTVKLLLYVSLKGSTLSDKSVKRGDNGLFITLIPKVLY